ERDGRDHALLLGRHGGRQALSRPRPVDLARGAGDLSESARAARGRDARPRRPPRRRDRLPVPAAPAPPGPAQRARLPHDHRRACGRAAWRAARRARGPHVGERPPALRFVSLHDLRLYVCGRINRQPSRLPSARGGGSTVTPPPVDAVIAGDRAPLALVRLLAGRPNVEREAAVARYLAARGVGFARQRFETFEGRGENFAVDVGAGQRVLLLIAHHDAVPGSPGANDNAASGAFRSSGATTGRSPRAASPPTASR